MYGLVNGVNSGSFAILISYFCAERFFLVCFIIFSIIRHPQYTSYTKLYACKEKMLNFILGV